MWLDVPLPLSSSSVFYFWKLETATWGTMRWCHFFPLQENKFLLTHFSKALNFYWVIRASSVPMLWAGFAPCGREKMSLLTSAALCHPFPKRRLWPVNGPEWNIQHLSPEALFLVLRKGKPQGHGWRGFPASINSLYSLGFEKGFFMFEYIGRLTFP